MKKILIVDDSPMIVKAVTRALDSLGHHIITATNGELGVASAKAEMPDLIVMDVIMPKLNGFQAARLLKLNPDTEHIPIIIMSTKDQEIDRLWAIRQGAAQYVVKPFDAETILAAVNATLETQESG